MNILINCSNLKVGGGVQVADSICCSLDSYAYHTFIVVLPKSCMEETRARLNNIPNIRIVRYDMPKTFTNIIRGRNYFLDKLVNDSNIDVVLTIFGPSIWSPRCAHLCGFARAHIVLGNSPYFKKMSIMDKLKNKLLNYFLIYSFNKSSNVYYTENPYITQKLKALFPRKKIFTISNYYNQVFDQANRWNYRTLEPFNGVTILSINAPYPHKNLGITVEIASLLRNKYPNFNFRFVLSVTSDDLPPIPNELIDHFVLLGKIDISECPSLYMQSDICFQPTLLECFTATYPEAMRMEVPIVTTDIDFAHGLCADAAEYYLPLSAESAASALHHVAINENRRNELIKNGKTKLKQFDTYSDRTEKIFDILENLKK